MKFKVGDEVVVAETGNESFLDLEGEILKIEKVHPRDNGKYYMLSFEGHKDRKSNSDYFELASIVTSPLYKALL